jgi:hypothetical protein
VISAIAGGLVMAGIIGALAVSMVAMFNTDVAYAASVGLSADLRWAGSALRSPRGVGNVEGSHIRVMA